MKEYLILKKKNKNPSLKIQASSENKLTLLGAERLEAEPPYHIRSKKIEKVFCEFKQRTKNQSLRVV